MSRTAADAPEEVIPDAEVVPEEEPLEVEQDPGAELVPVAPTAGLVVAGDTPGEVITKATEVADALKSLIDAQEMAVDVGGRKKHVEVGAWQACGTMLGALGGQPLHAETVWSRIAREPDGQPVKREYHVKEFHSKKQGGGLKREFDVEGYDWEARVEIRTPAGIVVGTAEALCSRAESTWATRPDPAVKSMAETRAESRAYRRAIGWIVNIAGYSATPAEEMGEKAQVESVVPPFAEAPSPELEKTSKQALKFLCAGDADVAAQLWKRVVDAPVNGDAEQKIGFMPRVAAQVIVYVAGAVQRRRTAGTVEVGTPSDEKPDRVSEEKARELCTCPNGYDAAQESDDERAGDCPIKGHGIPF